MNLAGMFNGYLSFTAIMYVYFCSHRKIFSKRCLHIDEKLKQNVRVTRASVLRKLDIARKSKYVLIIIRLPVAGEEGGWRKRLYDKAPSFKCSIKPILTWRGLRWFCIEALFKDYPGTKFPAAATLTIFLTLVTIKFAGAFTYWFGSWSGTAGVIIFDSQSFVRSKISSRSVTRHLIDWNRSGQLQSIESSNHINDTLVIMKTSVYAAQLTNNCVQSLMPIKPNMIFLCVSVWEEWRLTLSIANGRTA